jgi:tRNA (guanosine-2'-O-)-methyltransferase
MNIDLAIEKLAPYITDARKTKIEASLNNRISSVHIAAEAPSDPHNAAAIVRTAEALGGLHVHVIKTEGKALHAKRTTQGSFRWMRPHHHDNLTEFKNSLPKSTLIAGAVMNEGLPLEELPLDQPVCLLFGNENRGISDEARALCDTLFHIPMFGMSESLNLSVAAAMSLYATLKRKRKLLNKSGDLSEEELKQLRLDYYLNSVAKRLAKELLL